MTPNQHAHKVYDLMLAGIGGHHSMLASEFKRDAKKCGSLACTVIISEFVELHKANPIVNFIPLIEHWKKVKEEIKNL